MSDNDIVERLRSYNERQPDHVLWRIRILADSFKAATEIERLQSRIEELERALRPFVDLADEASSCHPSFDCNSDECVLEVFYGDDPSAFADIKFGDLRQARSVLEASNRGEK